MVHDAAACWPRHLLTELRSFQVGLAQVSPFLHPNGHTRPSRSKVKGLPTVVLLLAFYRDPWKLLQEIRACGCINIYVII